MVKLGGNGPIMANALSRLGLGVTYIGNLGSPAVHPVFGEFAERARVISIAEPGYTDAIEFDDGKLMFGKHQSLRDVNWNNLVKHVPEPELVKLFNEARFISLVNWTMLTQMTGIMQKLLTRVAPKLSGERRWIFLASGAGSFSTWPTRRSARAKTCSRRWKSSRSSKSASASCSG
jgi:hypothetical protein